ncbi:hypothetical protein [Microbulbifer sp. ARAS458-1]|uniref:hypothetical protein n=1 Tax=Microbulbifer sp. ARAS458-1 TaxID=3140242 RepID=UPI003878024E
MKGFITVLVLSLISASVFSYEPDRARSNQAHELAECAAFYSYGAVAVKRNGNSELSQELRRSADLALKLSEGLSNQETAMARFTMAAKEQGETINHDFSNISRLLLKSKDICKIAVTQPSTRYQYWLGQ